MPTANDSFLAVFDKGVDSIQTIPDPNLQLFAHNFNGHASLLVQASLKDDQFLEGTVGFSVQSVRKGEKQYFRITSTEAGLDRLFLNFIDDVLDVASKATSESAAIELLLTAVAEYREFFRRARRLSREEIRGLFAEVVLLRELLDRGVNPEDLLNAWRGPFANQGIGLRDFVFSDGSSLEVKSARQPATKIRVSSDQQLVPNDSKLDLLVLPVEETSSQTEGVLFVDYLSETAHLIQQASDKARNRWDDAIRTLGVDLEAEELRSWRLVPGQWRRFTVRDDFPHIVSSAIPKGVTEVRYSLQLSDLGQFEVEAQPLFIELGDHQQ